MTCWTIRPDTVPIEVAYTSFFLLYTILGTGPLIMAWLADM